MREGAVIEPQSHRRVQFAALNIFSSKIPLNSTSEEDGFIVCAGFTTPSASVDVIKNGTRKCGGQKKRQATERECTSWRCF